MLRQSCNFVKAVSPQVAVLGGISSITIIEVIKGCSQRHLHSLTITAIRNKIIPGSQKCIQLLKLSTDQKDFIWSSLLSQDKNKNSSNEPPIKVEELRCDGASSKLPIHTTSENSENGSDHKSSSLETVAIEPGDNKDTNICNKPFHEDKISKIPFYEESTHEKIQYMSSDEILQVNLFEAHNQKQDRGDKAGNGTEGKSNSEFKSNYEKTGHERNNTDDNSKIISEATISTNETVAVDPSKNENNGDSHHQLNSENESKLQKGKFKILLRKGNILNRLSSVSNKNEVQQTVNSGPATNANNPPAPKKMRQTFDLNKCSTERNFITPVRAMTDFLLKPSDLEGLRKTKRRSPYENEPPITVYWRKDVEAKAIDIWGSKENLLKEILKRDIERRRYQQNIFAVKRKLRDYRREQGRETESDIENGLRSPTGKVVVTAILINATNFVIKLFAWKITGSHSFFSESIHSLADTANQAILGYGIYKSVQRADPDHPYGYTNMKYVASLISGVAIFCLGAGLSFYHGYIGLVDPVPIEGFFQSLVLLGVSFVSEGVTLCMAVRTAYHGAKAAQLSFLEYVRQGCDPSINVILLEDAGAVLGIIWAVLSVSLSSATGSHIPDASGSFVIGFLLSGISYLIIQNSITALVGRSIPRERLDKINSELESDVMIRAIHDVKGIDIGNSLVRYKAEVDFDGRALTRSYLDKQDLNEMFEQIKKFNTVDDLEEFMLHHGENIVDMLGGEIDRIELKLRKKHPEIRHCDLEIL